MLRTFFFGDPNNPGLTKFIRGFFLGMVLFIVVLLLAISFADAAPPAHCPTPGYGSNYHGHDYSGHYDDHHVRIELNQVYSDLLWTVGPEVREKALAEKVEQRVRDNIAAKESAPKNAAEKSALLGKKALKLSCSSCHSPGTAAVTEDGAEPFYKADGTLKSLTGLERQAMLKAITAKDKSRMPPPPAPAVDDDDALDIKAFFDSLK